MNTHEPALTLPQLAQFYSEVIKSDGLSQLQEFYREVIKPESRAQLNQFHKEVIKPESLLQMNQFYERVMKLEITQSIQTAIFNLGDKMDSRFDDLYKKFEDLKQEYIFANEQLKRFERSDPLPRKKFDEFRSQVMDLCKRVEDLEKEIY